MRAVRTRFKYGGDRPGIVARDGGTRSQQFECLLYISLTGRIRFCQIS